MSVCASPGMAPGMSLPCVKKPSPKFTPSAPVGGRLSWYDFQLIPNACSWSAMVLPTVLGFAAIERTPSMFHAPSLLPGAQVVSLVQSMAGVAASVPTPQIGQTFGLDGVSVFAIPVLKFVRQLELCQSGLLSECTPKFEP